uniref:Uncharacterized protein n=1 Tax=Zea mays TaxID=4577 RepID=C0P994_MAIZE|nr:unknown [Zea mays]ACN31009.1 unknown [Zea mays]
MCQIVKPPSTKYIYFSYWSTNSKLKSLSTEDALKFVPLDRYGRGSDRRWKEVLQGSIVLKQTCNKSIRSRYAKKFQSLEPTSGC